MKNPGQEKHQLASALQLGTGVIDLMFGAWFAIFLWSMVGTLGGSIITACTMGM